MKKTFVLVGILIIVSVSVWYWVSTPREQRIPQPTGQVTLTHTDITKQTYSSSNADLVNLAKDVNKDGSKTYKNASFGIVFSHPSRMFVEEFENGIRVTPLSPDDVRRESSAAFGDMIVIRLNIFSLEEAEKTLKIELSSSKDTSIAGHPAREIISTPDGYSGSIHARYLVKTKKGVIEIRYLKDSLFELNYKILLQSLVVE